METISYNDFAKIDIRVGTIINAEPFEKAKKPAYILTLDFGDLGLRKSSAQITNFYKPEDLIGKQIIAVVNFPPKQIANFMSECLVLGVMQADNSVVLLSCERQVDNGLRIE